MKISFTVSGHVSQTIIPINGETAQEIVSKLNTGEYVTTLHDELAFVENIDNGQLIAEIRYTDNQLEYEDFEVEEA